MLQVGSDEYHLSLHPIYEDEEGKCNFRRQASIVHVRALLLLVLVQNLGALKAQESRGF